MPVPRPTLPCWTALLILSALAGSGSTDFARAEGTWRESFDDASLARWRVREGVWTVREGRAQAEGGPATLVRIGNPVRDLELTADVAYVDDEPHAAAGLAFRLGEDGTGYILALREVEKGEHPQFGAWERPLLQLWRRDPNGMTLLQESKVMGSRSGRMQRLKVVGRGPDLWAYHDDMATPVLREFDNRYDRPGAVALWKDHRGAGRYDEVALTPPTVEPPLPLRTDWSWVRGAVYVRSDAVNAVQMWHDYWDHTAALDRELSYAALYGFNMVQVYLHWIVWDRHQEEYLRRIDDFLTRAARHGLKVNLVFWDDCGHVEPALTFADPVPGRHNAQMMPNPSHRIRDSEPAMRAHEDRFRAYVEGVARRFRDDPRVAFWQLGNEPMGPKERYRDGEADANLNRLLARTREWVKATGTTIPVTATGGGFYGPKYSDFYTYHSYGNGTHPLPGADGGPEHLCTETLNRPDKGLEACLGELAGKRNGFVAWELMIGRDNCRFPWGHPDGPDEPSAPFHGVVYPDGHPWSVAEVRALLGADRYAALEARSFRVEYFDGDFQANRKTSITPRIDFDLGDEPGTGSPDVSAGLPRDDFSIRWTGRLIAPSPAAYTFRADTDGRLRLWLDDTLVLDKPDHVRRNERSTITLAPGHPYRLRVDYAHRDGPSSAHVSWNGPGFAERVLELDRAAIGAPP